MKRRLIALFDQLRVDLNEAIDAVERDDAAAAISKLRDMQRRIRAVAQAAIAERQQVGASK